MLFEPIWLNVVMLVCWAVIFKLLQKKNSLFHPLYALVCNTLNDVNNKHMQG